MREPQERVRIRKRMDYHSQLIEEYKIQLEQIEKRIKYHEENVKIASKQLDEYDKEQSKFGIIY